MGVVSSAVGLVLLLFGGLLVVGAAGGLKRWWDFRRLSVVPGRAVSDGQLVGLSGTVRDTGGLESPLDRTDCVAYKWIMETLTTGTNTGRRWDKRQVEGDIQRFDVETDDGTPVTIVPPDDVAPRPQLEVGTEVLYRVEPDEDPPDPVQALIDDGVVDEQDENLETALDVEFDDRGPIGTRRFRERAISAGDDLWLYGSAERVGTGLRLTPGSLFVLSTAEVDSLQNESIGMAVVLALAGATCLLFAYGFLI